MCVTLCVACAYLCIGRLKLLIYLHAQCQAHVSDMCERQYLIHISSRPLRAKYPAKKEEEKATKTSHSIWQKKQTKWCNSASLNSPLSLHLISMRYLFQLSTREASSGADLAVSSASYSICAFPRISDRRIGANVFKLNELNALNIKVREWIVRDIGSD